MPLSYDKIQAENLYNGGAGLIEVYVDGATAGNPGLSGAGIFIKGNGENLHYSIPLGNMTNHEAEYHALIKGLEICLEKNFRVVSFRTDSQLVDHAIEKEYVKNPEFAPLLAKALELSKQFDLFFLKWIPSSQNKVADELARKAIKQQQGGMKTP
jgi:ribonuclease HI